MMHDDSLPVNVLPVNNKYLVHDNLEIERLERGNDHLFELLLSQDIVHICVNSLATLTNYAKMEQDYIDEYSENLMLKAELSKKEHMVEKTVFDEVVLRCSRLKNRSVNLELKLQHQKETKLDAKDVSIAKLKKHIENFKGKNVVQKDATPNNAKVITSGVFKLDLVPLAPKLLKNKDAHIDYIKHSRENANTLREIVKHARALRPLDSDLDFAYKIDQRIQEVLMYVKDTYPCLTKASEKLVVVTPINRTRRVRWKPTGRTFTIDGNTCPLTRITSTKVELLRKPLQNQFRNDQIAKIMSYDLEVAFRKHMCYVQNLDGSDLVSGSRDTNLYTISLDDMLKSSLICLLSKASKTKSWLWHRRLSHLNFGSLNQLAKQGIVRGLPKLNFKKAHLCSACSLGKSKRSSHKPKVDDTNQEKLFLLHMDLYGPMHVEIINGKKYILAEAVLIHLYYNKTPYELMDEKKPDLSFLHVFRSLCYPTNDSEDLGKLKLEADIGLVPNFIPQPPCVPPINNDWVILFQPMFAEFFNPPLIVVSPVPVAAAPRLVDLTGSRVITKTPHFHDEPLHETLHEDSTSQGSSSNVRSSHTPLELLGKWTKNHPLVNVIADHSRAVFIRKQLKNDAMWCYFDAFLTSVGSKNFKEEMLKSSWIDTMQEEINEFERLQVCDPVDTLMMNKSKLDEDLQGKPFDPTHYHGMIGSLMYLASNRPDLVFAVCMCARYQAKPIEKHLHAVKRIFRYLKGTIDMVICWSSKKQKSTSISSTEAEYIVYLGVVLKSYG
ncbi:uncharacterized mitochondrial protein-like protein [Tanacetum coccineum]